MRLTSLFLIQLALFAVAGCSNRTVSNMEDYRAWINNERNGLIKTKYINGLCLQLKLLPSEYLVMKDYMDEKQPRPGLLDSLRKNYTTNLVFILNIGPDQRDGVGPDIMFAGANNYEEYKERFYEMSFFLEDKITLTMNDQVYTPAITALENVYGLKPDRNINIAFVPDDFSDEKFYSSEQFTLTFNDDIFQTGTSHFRFQRSDLLNAPKLKI